MSDTATLNLPAHVAANDEAALDYYLEASKRLLSRIHENNEEIEASRAEIRARLDEIKTMLGVRF